MGTRVQIIAKVYPDKLTAAKLRELTDELQAELDALELGKVFTEKASHLIKGKEQK